MYQGKLLKWKKWFCCLVGHQLVLWLPSWSRFFFYNLNYHVLPLSKNSLRDPAALPPTSSIVPHSTTSILSVKNGAICPCLYLHSGFQSPHPPSVIPRYFTGPTFTKEKETEYTFNLRQVKYSANHSSQLILTCNTCPTDSRAYGNAEVKEMYGKALCMRNTRI